jgi:ferredoxin
MRQHEIEGNEVGKEIPKYIDRESCNTCGICVQICPLHRSRKQAATLGTERIVWVKVNPDYEILFRLMDGHRPDTERRYWIREPGKDGNICDIGEEMRQMATEVKIAFPVSHNTLTIVEEYVR